jgi:hypothetical protein
MSMEAAKARPPAVKGSKRRRSVRVRPRRRTTSRQLVDHMTRLTLVAGLRRGIAPDRVIIDSDARHDHDLDAAL